jgi:hypothetical protein
LKPFQAPSGVVLSFVVRMFLRTSARLAVLFLHAFFSAATSIWVAT